MVQTIPFGCLTCLLHGLCPVLGQARTGGGAGGPQPVVGAATGDLLPEIIKWFIEDQAFLAVV
jgi:hypothetical protein